MTKGHAGGMHRFFKIKTIFYVVGGDAGWRKCAGDVAVCCLCVLCVWYLLHLCCEKKQKKYKIVGSIVHEHGGGDIGCMWL